nr:MAG TPA: hypothetical protein [Crassvirales sp.]DAG93462.1 MAG TPA: hypothetical protein [Crassvirales sp.]DAR45796.1 MAG TPA: hypothetical protein [Bacteriophage sp.]DAU06284.1 MAG TPA: hypothetical protein [Caudoviricetes sp.]
MVSSENSLSKLTSKNYSPFFFITLYSRPHIFQLGCILPKFSSN